VDGSAALDELPHHSDDAWVVSGCGYVAQPVHSCVVSHHGCGLEGGDVLGKVPVS
jgi:hypothetical protein